MRPAERHFDVRPLDMADTEHLKEIRELLRSLLAPRPLEEELSGVQDRGLGSRRKPVHTPKDHVHASAR
jgi:hypothetical protein